MAVTCDPVKNARNVRERGLSFDLVEEFEWSSAYVLEDIRRACPERRFQAPGGIGTRLHMLVLTPRGEDVHAVSCDTDCPWRSRILAFLPGESKAFSAA